jgi:pyruvate dehydrogenase E2 component (dihydrolipoamide acetyltransferase)
MIHFPLEVDGLLTRVLQAGDGDEAVVLLHGGLSTANRWQDSLEPLAAEGWRALAVDLPGRGFAIQTHGRSLTVPGVAEFVARFLDEMELERATLVGASLGAHVAAEVACRDPGRVTQLVMVGPAGVTPWDRDDRVRTWTTYQSFSRETIANGLTRYQPLASWEEIEETYRMRNTPSHQRAVATMADYMLGDAWEADFVDARLAEITPIVPTLVVWGEADTQFPVADAHALHDRLPGARFAIVAEADHDVDLDRPAHFHALLFAALRGRLDAFESPDVRLLAPR